MPEISSVASTIAFLGTIIGIFAASFQVLDQIEKRRDKWFQKLQNNNCESDINLHPAQITNIVPNIECRVDWGEAPPLQEILADLIKFISLEQETSLPLDVGALITLLKKYLRASRRFLILDNFESILTEGDKAGEYREGYEDYGVLLKRVGEEVHNSCLIITSREKPREVAASEGETLPVRSLQLSGLLAADGEVIFQEKGISGTEDEQIRLVDAILLISWLT